MQPPPSGGEVKSRLPQRAASHLAERRKPMSSPQKPVTVVNLPIAKIQVRLHPAGDGKVLGTITSSLKTSESVPPEHSRPDTGIESVEDQITNAALETAADTIESFVLACACAGIDIENPRFLKALQTTIDAVGKSAA
jgi:hypothetical protein